MPSTPVNAATPTTRLRRSGLTLALLAFAQLIISIDYNIVYVALPEIGDGLGFSDQTLQWVVSAYAVAFGGFLLFGGRAADLFGRRRMFVLGLLLYALSSLVGGLATAPGLLVAARAVQGLGGAFLFPATLSLVNTTFAEGRERNHALSVWAAAGASGMILGSLLGGVLTHALGWEAVFFVNVPLAGGAAALAFVLIAPDTRPGTSRTFDLPGAVTATVSATLLVFTLVQGPEVGWTSPVVQVSGLVGLLLLALFLVIESRSRDPLMPLRLYRNPNLSTGAVTTFLFMATFGTLLYFLTVYLQRVHGYSALATGMAFLVPMSAGFVGSMLGGRLATRFGIRRTMMVSYVLGAVGTAAVAAVMTTDSTFTAMIPGLIVLSLCQGVIFSTMFAAAATGVAAEDQGIVSGVVSTGQQFGSAMGLAVLVAIANSGTAGLAGEALRSAITDGLRTAVFVATGGILLLLVAALNFRVPAASAAEDPAAR